MDIDLDIARDPTAPAQARGAIAKLADRLDQDVLADARLLVSELVSNSVKYGQGRIVLHVRARGKRQVLVEVTDEGTSFSPHERRRSRFASGGFGLRLVEELSSRWGIHDDSARVWFEIDRSTDLAAAA